MPTDRTNRSTALRALLQVIPTDSDTFQGVQESIEAERVFGGQVLGQALVAAGRTVDDGILPHSSHARFLRAPSPKEPLTYRVNRARDGSSFFNREVQAEQSIGTVLTMSVSFQRNETGFEHSKNMPEAPDPETLTPFVDRMTPSADRLSQWFQRPRPIEVHYLTNPPWEAADNSQTPSESRVWMCSEPLDTDDPLIHRAALMYASDMTILDSAVLRHGLGWFPDRVRAATLDHAMWFHGTSRADSWFLYDQECPWTGSGRALVTGSMYSREGQRLATIVQEAVLRQPR
jgi:acyl-CoA thioesterase-2